jgi:hypothetical protein
MYMYKYVNTHKHIVHVRYRTVPVRCTGSCLASEEFLARDRLLQPSAMPCAAAAQPERVSANEHLGRTQHQPVCTPCATLVL